MSLAAFLAGGAAEGLGRGILEQAGEARDVRKERRGEAAARRGAELKARFEAQAQARAQTFQAEQGALDRASREGIAAAGEAGAAERAGERRAHELRMQDRRDAAAADRQSLRAAKERADRWKDPAAAMQARRALMDMVPETPSTVTDQFGIERQVDVPDPVVKGYYEALWNDRRGQVPFRLAPRERVLEPEAAARSILSLKEERDAAGLREEQPEWYARVLRNAGFVFDEAAADEALSALLGGGG